MGQHAHHHHRVRLLRCVPLGPSSTSPPCDSFASWAPAAHTIAFNSLYGTTLDYLGSPHPLRALIERKIGPQVGARHLLLVFLVALLSVFWSFWDPTWHAARLERARGRDPIVRYREAYLVRPFGPSVQGRAGGGGASANPFKITRRQQVIQMMAYSARLGMVISSWRQREAEPLSSRRTWTALTVLFCSFVVSPYLTATRNHSPTQVLTFFLLPFLRKALLSATLIPTLQPRTPVRLQARAKSSTSPTVDSRVTTFQSVDPLEPLANLSLSHNGSLLVPSPPTTPTPTGATTRRKQNATIRHQEQQQQQQPARNRRGSFSLGLRSCTRNSPSPLGVAAASTRPTDGDAASSLVDDENVDDAGETSMDWCPTPPPPSAPASTSSAFANRATSNDSPSSSSARFSISHVTFARQRFVPPDTRKPTGLEGMFERVVAVREDAAGVSGDVVPVAGGDVEMKSVASQNTGGGSSAWGLARWWK